MEDEKELDSTDNEVGQKKHPNVLEKVKECRKRKAAKKACIQATVTTCTPLGSSVISQAKVDQLVTNFIVEYMEPMSIVESQPFIELVQGLQPTKKVLSRKTLNG
ncbi:hypothetical protein HELRODRAFT_169252 [Helobdella robusta]|uniref:Uncharacterized protein n=1 Tax=Helobdella robusta TaxID=6412 RepID=T1F1N0_HELRO|nr:hypothetical protein HELRODRAFT_169252 [Helobdella robusta]ESO08414.1 hypothetical protein HELRODRAFT_169252 [Helobdella robusta]